jgi:hypothetical protein
VIKAVQKSAMLVIHAARKPERDAIVEELLVIEIS